MYAHNYGHISASSSSPTYILGHRNTATESGIKRETKPAAVENVHIWLLLETIFQHPA